MARQLSLGQHNFDLDERPLVMGILNTTPDSFSDGGNFFAPDAAVPRALQMLEEGADIIDVGGESTRPGSTGVGETEELQRVIPVIESIRRHSNAPISIDTTKAAVYAAAVEAGADMLNDISGLTRDPDIVRRLRRLRTPVIIMHSKGTPDVMQRDPHYADLFDEISGFLRRQADVALEAGAPAVIVDPGIGFGKTLEHNLQLITHLERFAEIGHPVLIGPSRKSFIAKALGLEADQRLEATLAAVSVSVLNGADIVRVHDVRECRRAADMAAAFRAVRSDVAC